MKEKIKIGIVSCWDQNQKFHNYCAIGGEISPLTIGKTLIETYGVNYTKILDHIVDKEIPGCKFPALKLIDPFAISGCCATFRELQDMAKRNNAEWLYSFNSDNGMWVAVRLSDGEVFILTRELTNGVGI